MMSWGHGWRNIPGYMRVNGYSTGFLASKSSQKLGIVTLNMTDHECSVGKIIHRNVADSTQAQEMDAFIDNIPNGTVYIGAVAGTARGQHVMMEPHFSADGLHPINILAEQGWVFVAVKGCETCVQQVISPDEKTPTVMATLLKQFKGRKYAGKIGSLYPNVAYRPHDIIPSPILGISRNY